MSSHESWLLDGMRKARLKEAAMYVYVSVTAINKRCQCSQCMVMGLHPSELRTGGSVMPLSLGYWVGLRFRLHSDWEGEARLGFCLELQDNHPAYP